MNRLRRHFITAQAFARADGHQRQERIAIVLVQRPGWIGSIISLYERTTATRLREWKERGLRWRLLEVYDKGVLIWPKPSNTSALVAPATAAGSPAAPPPSAASGRSRRRRIPMRD